jgi:hypothetical protein
MRIATGVDYALVKLKAIAAAKRGRKAVNVLKGRPIGPHTRHPLKHVYNRNATGHHFVLTSIRTGQRVSRMWKTSEYPQRLAADHAALQAQHYARGGGKLKYVDDFCDLDGMYTNCPHERMDEAVRNNIQRLRDSTHPDRAYPLRNLDRVSVGQGKNDGIKACSLGPTYNTETQVEIKFKDMIDICVHSNARSFMRVGRQVRHYHIGTPMGEQGSCAKANGLCLDDELRVDAEREA